MITTDAVTDVRLGHLGADANALNTAAADARQLDPKVADRLHRIRAWSQSYARVPESYKRRYVARAAEELRELLTPPASDQFSAAHRRLIRQALRLADDVTGGAS